MLRSTYWMGVEKACRYRVRASVVALGLVAAVLAPSYVQGQSQPNIQGQWKINGNGHVGDMRLSVAADGAVTGSIYGDQLLGVYTRSSRWLAFARLRGGKPIQVWRGQVWQTASPPRISGNFWAVAPGGGASGSRNKFNWVGRAMTSRAPSAPGLPTVSGPGPSLLLAEYILGEEPPLWPKWDYLLIGPVIGYFSGFINEQYIHNPKFFRIVGHYADGSNSMVFVRITGTSGAGRPDRFYVLRTWLHRCFLRGMMVQLTPYRQQRVGVSHVEVTGRARITYRSFSRCE